MRRPSHAFNDPANLAGLKKQKNLQSGLPNKLPGEIETFLYQTLDDNWTSKTSYIWFKVVGW